MGKLLTSPLREQNELEMEASLACFLPPPSFHLPAADSGVFQQQMKEKLQRSWLHMDLMLGMILATTLLRILVA